MFNTSVLDVAFGMVFIYLLLSLLCSATNELIELLMKKRATDLERGIRELLNPNSPSGASDVVQKIYNHPLVNGLYHGTYERSGIGNVLRYIKGTKLPSYIPARNFALALMDVAMPGTVAGAQSGAAGATSAAASAAASAATANATDGANQLTALRAELEKLGNPQLQKALTTLIDAAAGDVARARANIEDWYNSSMDRVSGWYKRRSHIVVLLLGFGVAVAVNADSVLIVRRLASDRALRESLVNSANVYTQETVRDAGATATASTTPPLPFSTLCTSVCNDETPQCKLKRTQCEIAGLGLPLGWSSPSDMRLNWQAQSLGAHVQDHIFGWLLTALAISLGAPFWFDVLNKFIVVRSTVKPKEKSREEKSKD
jgi:hypothetical protein